MSVILLLVVVLFFTTCQFSYSFLPYPTTIRRVSSTTNTVVLFSVAVPAAELDANLSPEERTVVNVVRSSSPAVAGVTLVIPASGTRATTNTTTTGLPPGRRLGSGSGFVVDQRGYLVTNYHVIEAVHQAQQQQMLKNPACTTNIATMVQRRLLPHVYVRIGGTSTQYHRAEIISVQPDIDLGLLKVNTTTTIPLSLQFGSSDTLLVGQRVIAIGNPFGLDTTVTTGVVSALQRDLPLARNRVIRGAIQCDAAINPGNSGGPLLNAQSQVIGINTAILSTSGSNAGIGFAVPAEAVAPVVRDMIRKDTRRVWLGVTVVGTRDGIVAVERVELNGPADRVGIRGLRIGASSVEYGDAIVAVGGNVVATYEELLEELDQRRVGEQLSITVQDIGTGEKRVVYLTAESKPN